MCPFAGDKGLLSAWIYSRILERWFAFNVLPKEYSSVPKLQISALSVDERTEGSSGTTGVALVPMTVFIIIAVSYLEQYVPVYNRIVPSRNKYFPSPQTSPGTPHPLPTLPTDGLSVFV